MVVHLLKRTGVLGTLFICLALIHLFTGTQLRSQSIYGTITGTVIDPSGGAVASANITLKNVASGDVRRSVTNSDGYYSFSSVPAGSYSLTVEAPGFQKAVTQGIDVTGAASLSFPVKLVLGAASPLASWIRSPASTPKCVQRPFDRGERLLESDDEDSS